MSTIGVMIKCSRKLRWKQAGATTDSIWHFSEVQPVAMGQHVALFSTTSKPKRAFKFDKDHWSPHRVSSFVGHSFPDFIEKWNRDTFKLVGYGLAGSTVVTLVGSWALYDFAILYHLVTPAVLGTVTLAYWQVGLNDIKQKSHAIRRNYPVLGNLRYIFETVSVTSDAIAAVVGSNRSA